MDDRPLITPAPGGAGDSGGGLTPQAAAAPAVRADVLAALALVKERHNDLQGILHQTMRRLALPTAREIGQLLITAQGLYKPGNRAGAGDFLGDAMAITGLGKAMIYNYISVAKNWGKLVDYMADLPEGAEPVTSLRGALEAIRAMNRPLPPAGGGAGAIDTDAQEVPEDSEPSVARADDLAARRAELAADAVRPVAKTRASLSALQAVRGLPVALRDRIETLNRALVDLLADVELALQQGIEVPEPTTTNLPAPVRAYAGPVNRVTHEFADYGSKGALYPDHPTADGAGPKDPSDGRMVVLSDNWIEKPGRPDQELIPVGSLSEGTAEKRPDSPLADRFAKTAEGLEALNAAIAAAGSGAALGRELGCSPQAVSDYRKQTRIALGLI